VHIDEMVAALRAIGNDVRIVAPRPSENGKAGEQASWVQRLRTLLPKAVYEVLELAYSVVAYARLARAAAEFKPDVVYERYNLYLLAA
jgi:hypothetical protein